MPLYGAAQAGSNSTLGLNLTSLEPGQEITLLSGSETVPNGTASIAFARGYSPDPAGITFNLAGMPTGSSIDVQVAAADIAGQYVSVVTLTPDANGNAAYTDVGLSPFFRLAASSATASTGTIAKATR